jgi:hypothetical protein
VNFSKDPKDLDIQSATMNTVWITAHHPFPFFAFGEASLFRTKEGNGKKYSVQFECQETVLTLSSFLNNGKLPSSDKCKTDFMMFAEKFNVPLIDQLLEGDLWTQGDTNLWFYQIQGLQTYQDNYGYTALELAGTGNLDTLIWFIEAGGTHTTDVVDEAVLCDQYDVVWWYVHRFNYEITDTTSNWALATGRLSLMKFMSAHRIVRYSRRAYEKAKLDGHIQAIEFIDDNHSWNKPSLSV